MSGKTFGIALLGLVIIAVLALPVSAAATDGNGQAGQAIKIDSGLKNDLWNTYGKYRLQIYDTRVDGANEIVSDLGRYGCPTGSLQATITSIGNEKDPLADALKNHDRKSLRTVNQDLVELWKQFREQVKDSIKSCSVQPLTANPQVTTTGAQL